mgnify:FL=1
MNKKDYIKEFISKLSNLDRSRSVSTVFNDFLTLSCCSLAQTVYRSDNLEQRYLNIVKTYTKEQAEEFSKLLAFLVLGLEQESQDFLGQVYMFLNLGSQANGQYFTPYSVSKFMAEINFTKIESFKSNQLITLSEPCCGSGALIIAFAQTLREHNINYQQNLFVEAIDISEMCFKMTYIQLSLLGIPAKVLLGDTLAMKFKECLYTPFYYLSGIDWKLKQQKQKNEFKISPINQGKTIQLSLFN